MAKSNARSCAIAHHYIETAITINKWLRDNRDLLEGTIRLRNLGPKGAEVADIILALEDIQSFRLGWELLNALLSGEGIDPEALLLTFVPWNLLDLGRRALWAANGSAPS